MAVKLGLSMAVKNTPKFGCANGFLMTGRSLEWYEYDCNIHVRNCATMGPNAL